MRDMIVMAGTKADKIKIYMVIALSMVLIINGYFRFFHGKGSGPKDGTPSGLTPVQFEIPKISPEIPPDPQTPGSVNLEPVQALMRDIFSPLNATPAGEMKTRKKKDSAPPPAMRLKGIVVGGENPVALIDDRFVRKGDWIGEYRVVRIEKKAVLLDSGERKILLELLKNG